MPLSAGLLRAAVLHSLPGPAAGKGAQLRGRRNLFPAMRACELSGLLKEVSEASPLRGVGGELHWRNRAKRVIQSGIARSRAPPGRGCRAARALRAGVVFAGRWLSADGWQRRSAARFVERAGRVRAGKRILKLHSVRPLARFVSPAVVGAALLFLPRGGWAAPRPASPGAFKRCPLGTSQIWGFGVPVRYHRACCVL